MTVTHTDEVELSIEQRALAIENIKLDRQLITEAILNQGLGRGWHTIEFPLVLDPFHLDACPHLLGGG